MDRSTSIPWVDGLTIGHVLRETARRYPQVDAYVFRQQGRRATWSAFDHEVDQVALGLRRLGFRAGDHFGVWATNVPEWLLLQFATARLGVVLVTINPAYRAAELLYAMRHADLRGLALVDHFKSTDYLATLKEACPQLEQSQPGRPPSDDLPRLEWIITLRGTPPRGTIGWHEVLDPCSVVTKTRRDDAAPATDGYDPARLDIAPSGLSPADPVNIQFTSGTTGHPKGATLSHRNLLWNAYYAGQNQRLTAADRLCIPVPLYHCFGCVLGTLCATVHGATMVFPSESFHAGETLAAIEAERCTVVYGVPTMFIAQLEHPDFPQRDLTSLRTGIMAGSPCPIELMKRVTRDMGAREITIGYGQTEAAPLITQTHADDPLDLRVGTVGRPLPGIEVRIVDPATRQPLDDLHPGELCARGHNVMLGYYNQPDKTAQVIDADGWLYTGDQALRQPNGYFRITGRLRDLIIRGGENIYPREIEERLFEHPAVESAYVVGVPDRKFGEETLAWVKLRAGCTATSAELRDFCRETLAYFKVPHYWKFVDSFPTTVTGKVQKYKIREQAIVDLGLEAVARTETA